MYTKDSRTYTFSEARKMCLTYFSGDEIATDAYLNKYALKQDGDINKIYEPTPDYMHRRLAKEFARIERKYENPLSEDEIFSLFEHFKYVIPQGGSMAGIGNPMPVSLSNCFVIGNTEDSYGAICKTDEEQVQISKRRGGVGHDLSYLRPKGMIVHNAASTSSGMVSFMERYSHSIREVCQGGRRGALMLSCSIKHPQVADFIDAKMESGKVTGANISVKITDDFMESVKNHKSFVQQFPIDSDNPEISNKIDSSLLWKKIIHNAWKSAEPGVLFWDTILKESTARLYGKKYEEFSTNPCFAGNTIIHGVEIDGVKQELITIKELAELGKPFILKSSAAYKNNKWNFDTVGKIATARYSGKKKTIKLVLSNESFIVCTPEHKIACVDGTYMEAQLMKGKQLVSPIDKNVYVTNIVKGDEIDVYDITVDVNHNYTIETSNNKDKKLLILVKNCGEIPLAPYGACVLNCMNLYSYVNNPFTKDAKFDSLLFIEHVGKAMRLTDDIIELEKEKVQQIIDKIKSDPEDETTKVTELNLWKKIYDRHNEIRRVGLGITGLGDMLAALGYTYGTPDATNFAAFVQKLLATSGYATSIEMAKERGAFKIWNYDIEKEAPFVNRILPHLTMPTLTTYWKYGRRNCHCFTIAPTGTVSCLTQTTSGIECVFMPYYIRRRKVDTNEKYDFKDETGDCFQEYIVVHPKLAEWYRIVKKPGLTLEESIQELSKFSNSDMKELVKESPYYHATTQDVDWVEKVRMQGELQKWVDHSISVTVNLPKEATEELVSKVYMTAWESGCKGCTIYRDGSRDGVLINKEDKKSKKVNVLSSGHMSKRKPVLPAIVDVIKSRGETFAVLIGIDEGRPYEVFAFKIKPEEVDIFKNNKQTTITKVAKKHYSLGKEFEEIDSHDNILERFGSEEEQAITRMVSTMLRGGRIPLEEIIDQIIKSSTSIEKFSKALAICLQKFLKDGLVLHEKCPNCGGDMISYEGCKKCVNCGHSKCG